MHLYFTSVIFILGLVIASFYNALLYRIDNGYKYPDIFIRGSHCEKCHKQLTWYELIPILSFVIFRGKCKQCGYKVPLYYPISEFILGLSLASVYYFSFGIGLYIVVLFLFAMSYYDRIYKGIPKEIVHVYLLYVILVFILQIILQDVIPKNAILLSSIFTGSTYLLSKLMKKPFGMGDLLVIFGLGFVLSPINFISFLFLFLFVALLYASILILQKKATLKSSLPLLPIMYISFSLMLLLNQQMSLILEKIFLI